MAFLAAYFDESGTHDSSPVVVVAGVVSSTKQWLKFDQRWCKALAEEKISVFHMTDFESSEEEFKGWAPEKKRPFIIRLLEIIKKHTRVFFFQAVYKKDFAAALSEFPDIDKSPYNMCCELNALAFSVWAGKSSYRKEYSLFFEKRNVVPHLRFGQV